MRNLKLMLAPVTLALLLAGCGPKATDATQSTETGAAEAETGAADIASDAATTVSEAAAGVKEALTPVPNGQDFADKAAKSDAFEIAEAKLVEAKATSPELKHFAMMMIKDHSASTALVIKAAGQASPAITPDPTLTYGQNRNIEDLRKLSGADFDHAYVDQQIDAHKAALSLMTVYADKGDTPTLKAAAGKIKPKVQMHLDAIKAIKAKQS